MLEFIFHIFVSSVSSLPIFGTSRLHISCFRVPSSEETSTFQFLLFPPRWKLPCPQQLRLVLSHLSNRIDDTNPLLPYKYWDLLYGMNCLKQRFRIKRISNEVNGSVPFSSLQDSTTQNTTTYVDREIRRTIPFPNLFPRKSKVLVWISSRSPWLSASEMQFWSSFTHRLSKSTSSPSNPTTSWKDECTHPEIFKLAFPSSFCCSWTLFHPTNTEDGVNVDTNCCLRTFDCLIVDQYRSRPWWWWSPSFSHSECSLSNFWVMLNTFSIFSNLVFLKISEFVLKIWSKMNGGCHRRRHAQSPKQYNCSVCFFFFLNVASIAEPHHFFCKHWKSHVSMIRESNVLQFWWSWHSSSTSH